MRANLNTIAALVALNGCETDVDKLAQPIPTTKPTVEQVSVDQIEQINPETGWPIWADSVTGADIKCFVDGGKTGLKPYGEITCTPEEAEARIEELKAEARRRIARTNTEIE